MIKEFKSSRAKKTPSIWIPNVAMLTFWEAGWVQRRKMFIFLTQWDRNLMNATSIWIPSLRFAIEVPFFFFFFGLSITNLLFLTIQNIWRKKLIQMSNVLTQWDRSLMNAASIWISSLKFDIEMHFFLSFGQPS